MRPRRLLIVEDDDDLRDVITGLLELSGFVTTTAASGLEGIARLAGPDLPDLVLLDLMMPGSDGYEFRAHQRADPRLAEVPVIAMTAMGLGEARLGELGAVRVIKKPFDFDALLALIDSVVPPT